MGPPAARHRCSLHFTQEETEAEKRAFLFKSQRSVAAQAFKSPTWRNNVLSGWHQASHRGLSGWFRFRLAAPCDVASAGWCPVRGEGAWEDCSPGPAGLSTQTALREGTSWECRTEPERSCLPGGRTGAAQARECVEQGPPELLCREVWDLIFCQGCAEQGLPELLCREVWDFIVRLPAAAMERRPGQVSPRLHVGGCS